MNDAKNVAAGVAASLACAPSSPWMTVKQAASYAGCHEETIRRGYLSGHRRRPGSENAEGASTSRIWSAGCGREQERRSSNDRNNTQSGGDDGCAQEMCGGWMQEERPPMWSILGGST